MYKNILIKILPWVLAILFGVMCVQQCQDKKTAQKNAKHNTYALTDSIKYYKDKYGNVIAEKAILIGDIKTLADANDSLAKRIKAMVKNPEQVVYVDHVIEFEKHDTVWNIKNNEILVKQNLKRSFDFSNKWRTLAGNISVRDTTLGLTIDQDKVNADFAIAIKNGRAYVSSSNPYVHVNDIQGFQLPKERKKWFHIGPSAGVGIGLDGKIRPYLGVTGTVSILSW